MPDKDVVNAVEEEFGVEGFAHKVQLEQEMEDFKNDRKNGVTYKYNEQIKRLEEEQDELEKRKQAIIKKTDELKDKNKKYFRKIETANADKISISKTIEDKILGHTNWEEAVDRVNADYKQLEESFQTFRSTGRPNTSKAYEDMLGAIDDFRTMFSKADRDKIGYKSNKTILTDNLNKTLQLVNDYILKKTDEGYPSKWKSWGIGNTRLAAAQAAAQSIKDMIKDINKVPLYEDFNKDKYIEEQNEKIREQDEKIRELQGKIEENKNKINELNAEKDECQKTFDNNNTKIQRLKIEDADISLKDVINRYRENQRARRINAVKKLNEHNKIKAEQKKQTEQQKAWQKEDETLKNLKEEYKIYEMAEKRSVDFKRKAIKLSDALNGIRNNLEKYRNLRPEAEKISEGLNDKIATFSNYYEGLIDQYEGSSMGEFTTAADKLSALNDKFQKMDDDYSKLDKKTRKSIRDSMDEAYNAVNEYMKKLNPNDKVDRYQSEMMTDVIDCIKDISTDMVNYHNKVVEFKKTRDNIAKQEAREMDIEEMIKDNNEIIKKCEEYVNKNKASHKKMGEQIKELEAKIKNRKLSGSNMNKSQVKAHTM